MKFIEEINDLDSSSVGRVRLSRSKLGGTSSVGNHCPRRSLKFNFKTYSRSFLPTLYIMSSFVPPETVLKDFRGNSVQASDLWSQNPALVIILRRPGCLLCRDQAIGIWNERERLAKLSGDGSSGKKETRLICIVHEWKDREIDAFTKDYWGGEIYFDESKAFYAAVHGGTIKKGSMLSMLNPFSKAWKNIREVSKRGLVTDHNMEGDGATLGGLAVLDSPNGNAVYTFEEKAFGDKASMEDIFKAVGSLYK